MGKKQNNSLFKRLTRLFRSGPVIRRKVRSLDTVVAGPDKMSSSGVALFQKSTSPTYANITANAYNLSERLMRYQDFNEMEYCVDGATRIPQLDGTFKTIATLAAECADDPEKTFFVYSYDHEKKQIVPAIAKQARQTRVDKAWRVKFDNGQEIIASENHRLMLRDGTYREVRDLQPGDSMMPFYRKDLFENATTGVKGYQWIYTMDKKMRGGWTKEHKLIAEWVAGRELIEDEVVHHINFNKSDNRPENLRIMTASEHGSYHQSLNNDVKWSPENSEWVEKFKKQHSAWMRDHAPTKRKDVTFARILEVSETCGFNMSTVSRVLDVDFNLLHSRLQMNGFRNFDSFVNAYRVSGKKEHIENSTECVGINDLSLEKINAALTEDDTKITLCMKLNCTVNVFNKFCDRRLLKSWSELRHEKGWKPNSQQRGGRPCKDSSVAFKRICDAFEAGITLPRLAMKTDLSKNQLLSCLVQNGYKKYGDFTDSHKNHKVVSVEYVGVMPLYDMTVDGYKNFATDSVISHNTPELAAALDVYSDECVAQDEKGRVLHVYSENAKIKSVLDDLFYNVLNVEFNLRSWVRNLPVRSDTVIPLLDGRNITIEQLAHEFDDGKSNWVYSVQDGTNKLVPGKVNWCGLTRTDSELVRVWLDDGTYVDTTPDHEFKLRTGELRQAQHLVEGESLMPFYTRVSDRSRGDKMSGYLRVYDPQSRVFEYMHRVVFDDASEQSCEMSGCVIHHVDFNKRNNVPENLTRMTWTEHCEYHAKVYGELCAPLLKRPEVIAKKKASLKRYAASDEGVQSYLRRGLKRREFMSDPDNNAAFRDCLRIKFDDECLSTIERVIVDAGKYIGAQRVADALRVDETFMAHFRSINHGSGRDLTKTLNRTSLCALVERETGKVYHEFVVGKCPEYVRCREYRIVSKSSATQRAMYRNHKVSRVERISEKSDVYCMEVLGPGGQPDRHNFAVLSKDREGQISLNSGVFVGNCKYGDFVLFNDVSSEYGVVNAFPIPINEIEREEGFDRSDPFAVRYRWLTLGNRVLENWEVTHFRLLGNDQFLPYGSSVIEPARRIWRQLILIEDAMLVYRITRAPERRVFYIDVGNIPNEEAPRYVEEQRKQLRTQNVVENSSGRVDLRYNPMPMHWNTSVPLLDGRMVPIKQLAAEVSSGAERWVYSVQDGTNVVVPGKVTWCGKNYAANRIVKVTLDDGTYVKAAPEHPFIMRDGSCRRADELRVGDSLMSAYVEENKRGYERIVEPNGDRTLTHALVARDVYREAWASTASRVVHHKHVENRLHNKRDNSPSNLEVMGFWDHRSLHAKHCNLTLNRPDQLIIHREMMIAYNKSPQKRARTSELNRQRKSAQHMGACYNGTALHASHNVNRRKAQLKSWSTNKETRCENMRWIIPNEVMSIVFAMIKSQPTISSKQLVKRIREDSNIVEMLKRANASSKRDPSRFFAGTIIAKLIRMGCLSDAKYKTFRDFVLNNDPPVNHQVTNVEVLTVMSDDVYCMTVVGPNDEDDRHNFAVCGLSESTDTAERKSFIFVKNSVDEDFYLAVRGTESGTRIDTLKGGENTAAVEDVEYIQKKLFAAIKIPRAYLGYEDMLGCLAGDTRVPCFNGQTYRIDELARRDWSRQDDPVYVYSCVPDTGEVRPGKVIRAWKTKDVTRLYEVTLDGGQVVRCTENHPFLCRDGTYRRADELVVGQSLMAQYRKLSDRRERDFQDGYEKLYDNATGGWKYTHRLVNERGLVRDDASRVDERSYVVHHIDGNKRNNDPSNLVKMGKRAHALHHSTGITANLLTDSSRARLREVMKSDEYVIAHRSGVKRAWDQDDGTRRALVARSNVVNKATRVTIGQLEQIAGKSRCTKEFYEKCREELLLSGTGVNGIIRRAEFDVRGWLRSHVNPGASLTDLKDFVISGGLTSLSFLRGWPLPVGCPMGLGVAQRLAKQGYGSLKAFANKELFHNHKVVSINVVELDVPVPVYDLEVEGWHNFLIVEESSSIPWASGVYVHNSKATLSQQDIRFSRTINVIQKTVIAELNKLAIIHLFAHGFDGDDLVNFTLMLSNPSTVAQQQKLELWRAKFDIASNSPEGVVTKEFVQQEILGLTDDQIKHIEQRRMYEAQVDASVESISGGESSGGAGGGGGGSLFGGGGSGLGGGEELGGDLESGGSEGGGTEPSEEPAAEEPPEDLEAGEAPGDEPVEDDIDVELLLSVDDDDSPVRVSPNTKAHREYTAGRQRAYRNKHGSADVNAASTNFTNMLVKQGYHTKAGAKRRAEEAGLFNVETFDRTAAADSVAASLSGDVVSMLEKMSDALHISRRPSDVLTESDDERVFIDIDDEGDE